MSDQPAGGAFLDSAFTSIMDTLVPDEAPAEGGAAAAPAGGAAGEGAGAPAGAAAPPGPLGVPGPDGAPGADGPAAEPPGVPGGAGPATPADGAGAGGDAGVGGDGSAGGDPGPVGTVDYAAVAADLSGLSQKFEETSAQAFQGQALEAVQTEYKPYFDMLRQHPRMLVGQQVPSLQGADGEMETLRDAADAREYQEAVKALLTEEVRERTTASLEENKGILDTVSASIELFTRNKDLVPGTRQFDRALADRFAAMAKPYELRVDGKLHGFTIPVQPLIDSLRAQLVAERATARPAAPAAAAAAGGRPASRPADPPQAGIGSKAGASSDGEEDFSTLFGTLGLPNLRI